MLTQQLFYTLKEADMLQAAEFCIDLQHLYRFGTVPSTEYSFLWAKNSINSNLGQRLWTL